MGFSGRGKLVSELDSISSLADTDIVQISSGNVFKKMTIAQLKEELGINALNTNSSGARAYRVFFQIQAGWLVSTDVYFPDASGNTRSITAGTIVGEGSLSSDQIGALNGSVNKSSRIWTWQTTNSVITTALAGKIVALTIS